LTSSSNPVYGSADISPIFGAFAIATKGHFLETNPDITTPKLYNKLGDVIVPLEK
jgi:hypothetical protein